jgi:hypothetical protein
MQQTVGSQVARASLSQPRLASYVRSSPLRALRTPPPSLPPHTALPRIHEHVSWQLKNIDGLHRLTGPPPPPPSPAPHPLLLVLLLIVAGRFRLLDGREHRMRRLRFCHAQRVDAAERGGRRVVGALPSAG